MGYTKNAISGMGWLGILRAFTRGSSLIKLAILARFLAPEDFGLFGMVALTLALLETLTETGINLVLIGKRDIEKSIDTSYVISVVRGIVIACVLFMISWPVSWFFSEPLLVKLVWLVALVPLVRGFINPSIIIFQKNLEFQRESLLRSNLIIIDLAASVLLVLMTGAITGLILAMIVTAVAEVFLSWWLCLPRPKFILNKTELRSIISLGKWLNITVIANYLSSQIDSILIGRLMGAQMLGLYQMAYKLAHAPILEIGNVVSQTTYPIMSYMKGDTVRMFKAFYKSCFLVTLSSGLIALILGFWPNQIVLLVFGSKWMEAAIVVPVLALAALIRSHTSTSAPIFLANEQTKVLAMTSIIRLIGMGVGLALWLNVYGLLGAGLAVLVGNIIVQPYMWYKLWKLRFW